MSHDNIDLIRLLSGWLVDNFPITPTPTPTPTPSAPPTATPSSHTKADGRLIPSSGTSPDGKSGSGPGTQRLLYATIRHLLTVSYTSMFILYLDYIYTLYYDNEGINVTIIIYFLTYVYSALISTATGI